LLTNWSLYLNKAEVVEQALKPSVKDEKINVDEAQIVKGKVMRAIQ